MNARYEVTPETAPVVCPTLTQFKTHNYLLIGATSLTVVGQGRCLLWPNGRPCQLYCWTWCSGNIIGRINEVTLRRARLVLGWVTVFGGKTTSVFHQATQANSASYSQWDKKWVPAKVRWCSAAVE